jgi:hypothetical protein
MVGLAQLRAKRVSLYRAYSFLDIGGGVDLQELVDLLEAVLGRGAAGLMSLFFDTN